MQFIWDTKYHYKFK